MVRYRDKWSTVKIGDFTNRRIFECSDFRRQQSCAILRCMVKKETIKQFFRKYVGFCFVLFALPGSSALLVLPFSDPAVHMVRHQNNIKRR